MELVNEAEQLLHLILDIILPAAAALSRTVEYLKVRRLQPLHHITVSPCCLKYSKSSPTELT